MDLKISTLNTPAELRQALALIKESFMEFEAPYYEQQGVNHFLDYIAFDAMQKRIQAKELILWLAKSKQKILGVIAMRPPRAISLLFVDKYYHKKGIARLLFEHAKREYRHDEATPLTVHSSPYAVTIYQKLGFLPQGPEQTEHGIRYTPMIYYLSNS